MKDVSQQSEFLFNSQLCTLEAVAIGFFSLFFLHFLLQTLTSIITFFSYTRNSDSSPQHCACFQYLHRAHPDWHEKVSVCLYNNFKTKSHKSFQFLTHSITQSIFLSWKWKPQATVIVSLFQFFFFPFLNYK